ncbi:hypothetical protein [Shewanella algae]|uniref:hypothetical protein n=1 Tax=Shewanella algae TaxID=38313 RepID=UPI0031F55633
MPKKTEDGDHQYIKATTDSIKNAISLRQLYVAIHGNEPSRQELQRFSNRFNLARSNPGADMLGLCIRHIPALHEVTLKEFFGLAGEADDSDA